MGQLFSGAVPGKVIKIALGIAGSAIAASALISYAILGRAEFHHPFLIAAALFCCSVLWFCHKWRGEKGKAYLLRRFAEIPPVILEKESGRKIAQIQGKCMFSS